MFRLPLSKTLEQAIPVPLVEPAAAPVGGVAGMEAAQPEGARRHEQRHGREVPLADRPLGSIALDEGRPARIPRLVVAPAPAEDRDVVGPPARSAAVEIEQ